MTNYREILRLQSLGMNKQETAASVFFKKGSNITRTAIFNRHIDVNISR